MVEEKEKLQEEEDPVSPWGQSAKGLKTRKNKRTDKYIISRKKKRK